MKGQIIPDNDVPLVVNDQAVSGCGVLRRDTSVRLFTFVQNVVREYSCLSIDVDNLLEEARHLCRTPLFTVNDVPERSKLGVQQKL